MERFFNTAGPIIQEDHYNIPPLTRWDLEDILELIRRKRYFVLHAPRQTGKTSCLLALRDYLNKGNEFYCIYANIEGAQAAREKIFDATQAILSVFGRQAEYTLKDFRLSETGVEILKKHGHHDAILRALGEWCQQLDRPLVLLIDEVDSLIGDTLISLLRQIRSGYSDRPAAFPISIVLCGLRDALYVRIVVALSELSKNEN